MKKKLLKSAMISSAIFFSASDAFSQQEDIGQFVKTGAADASKLIEAYLAPASKGFAYGLNSAWFNSAKTKNLLKFDLKLQTSFSAIPTDEQTFDVSKIGLSNNTRPADPNNTTAQTFLGENIEGPTLDVYVKDPLGNDVKGESFRTPNGSGFNYAPTPTLQLTVGLIKNTDISLRYIPTYTSDKFGTINSFGIGVKHEITKLIMPGKTELLMPFDLAVAFGYNKIKYDYKVAKADQLNENPATQFEDLNQRLAVEFSGYTFDAIISKKLLFFTPFASIGYNSGSSKFQVLGDYIVKSGATVNGQGLAYTYDRISDPVKIDKKEFTGIRGNVGFSLHLLFFRVYGAYSIGEYSAYTGGIGIGIGK